MKYHWNLPFDDLDKSVAEICGKIAPRRLKGKSVFIKPNLVCPPTKWDIASTTDIRVVKALVRWLWGSGVSSIRVGDCGFKDQWELTMELSGYRDLENMGVELIPLQMGENFHKFTLHRFDHQSDYLSLYGAKLSDYALECDLWINVPTLKMHSMAFLTCSIKNMMGIMGQKGSMHPKADRDILQKRLRDLYFLLRERVSFALTDGLVGSEYTEHYGVPVEHGILFGSNDMWLNDCLAAQFVGLRPIDVPYLRYIQRDMDAEIPEVPEVMVKTYEKPLAWRTN